jgi:hypothetical protein
MEQIPMVVCGCGGGDEGVEICYQEDVYFRKKCIFNH